ncbi:MAG: hypothetical protein ACPGWR_10700 [Ardenticatenaceae bacterium]
MVDGDRLLLRASLDQQTWFDEVNLVWGSDGSGIYSTNMNYQPNNAGFGRDYYWTLVVIGADGTQYGSPAPRKFRWEDPNSDNGGPDPFDKKNEIPPAE